MRRLLYSGSCASDRNHLLVPLQLPCLPCVGCVVAPQTHAGTQTSLRFAVRRLEQNMRVIRRCDTRRSRFASRQILRVLYQTVQALNVSWSSLRRRFRAYRHSAAMPAFSPSCRRRDLRAVEPLNCVLIGIRQRRRAFSLDSLAGWRTLPRTPPAPVSFSFVLRFICMISHHPAAIFHFALAVHFLDHLVGYDSFACI